MLSSIRIVQAILLGLIISSPYQPTILFSNLNASYVASSESPTINPLYIYTKRIEM